MLVEILMWGTKTPLKLDRASNKKRKNMSDRDKVLEMAEEVQYALWTYYRSTEGIMVSRRKMTIKELPPSPQKKGGIRTRSN